MAALRCRLQSLAGNSSTDSQIRCSNKGITATRLSTVPPADKHRGTDYTQKMFGSLNGSFRIFLIAASSALVLIAGCRSPHVQTTVVNSGNIALHNVEVDYPSASFGIPNLAPGEAFHYRIQLRDAGRLKVQFSDKSEHSHTGTGPYVGQGQQGNLTITLDSTGKNTWAINLHPQVATPDGD